YGLALDISPSEGRYQLAYENVKISDHEDMGFLSGAMLFKARDWLMVGPSASGAITGDRGGFITIGVDTHLRYPLNNRLELIGGALIGAGGGRGGQQLSGGGLMTRTYLALNLAVNPNNHLGLGYSVLDFPNGSIHSTQPYLIYEQVFSTFLRPGWVTPSTDAGTGFIHTGAKEQDIALTYRRYLFSNRVTTVSGNQQLDLSLMGIRWRHALDNRFYLSLGTEGAAGGESSGYMQILANGGMRFKLSPSTLIRFSAGTGVAGGGNTDTGGGWLVDARLGFQFSLSSHWFIEAEGGYIDSPEAPFKASSLSTMLGYRFLTPTPDRNITNKTHTRYHPVSLRIRPAIQRYHKADSQWRKQNPDTPIDVLGLQLDDFIHRNFYLTGQSFAAYSGKAGAYMTGLVGLGWHYPLSPFPLFFEAEGLLGAAGGGGVNVSDGLVYQGNVFLGMPLKGQVDVLLGGGTVAAVNGPFQARVLALSLAYRFSSFMDW
ncbi:MAG: hypothetical protein D6698_05415, partial [Gammaproteobacteria bacterium]